MLWDYEPLYDQLLIQGQLHNLHHKVKYGVINIIYVDATWIQIHEIGLELKNQFRYSKATDNYNECDE